MRAFLRFAVFRLHRITPEYNNKFRPSGAVEICLVGASGGSGGIRTHGTVPRTLVFKTRALNHSATLPCPSGVARGLRVARPPRARTGWHARVTEFPSGRPAMPARSLAEYSAGWRCRSAPHCRSTVSSDQVSCRGIPPKRAGGLFLALLRRYDDRRAGMGRVPPGCGRTKRDTERADKVRLRMVSVPRGLGSADACFVSR